MSRDDFTEATKNKLAKAVGWLCSNPKCQKVTVGSNSDHTGIINVGVACHKDQLIHSNLPVQSKRGILTILVLNGYILEAGLVLSGVQTWMAEAQKKQWMLQQSLYELEEWLTLLPFTDRPEAALDGAGLLAATLTR
ncbi:MAG: hypothetical protein WC612_01940 [Bdellovibrionales bacterium]|jgi:hypothetical protein